MSFNRKAVTTADKILASGALDYTPQRTVEPWYRNPSWPALPTVTNTEQKCVALHSVYSGGQNFVAFTVTGAYTVDWGDGTAVENIATGVTALHNFDFTAAALDNTNAPATFTQSTSTVNRTAHGYSNGMKVQFYNITTTTGVEDGFSYYVINATADTFQISKVAGGSVVSFATGDGSCTLLPHKTAIITITPQAGQTFTDVNLNVKHTTPTNTYHSQLLDIKISAPQMLYLRIGSGSLSTLSANVYMRSLEQVELLSSSIVNAYAMFYHCTSLRSVPTLALSTKFYTLSFTSSTAANQTLGAVANDLVVGMSVGFLSVGTLTAPALAAAASQYFVAVKTSTTAGFTTSWGTLTGTPFSANGQGVTAIAGISTNYMFAYSGITEVPESVNWSNIVSCIYMFSNARRLVHLNTNFSAVTNTMCFCTRMFENCTALVEVPPTSAPYVRSVTAMYRTCNQLRRVPWFDASEWLNMGDMYYMCFSLEYAPELNTPKVTNFNYTHYFNVVLRKAPAYDMSKCTQAISMYSDCYELTSIPDANTVLCTNASTAFANCRKLVDVPNWSFAACTNVNQLFTGCRSLVNVGDLNFPVATTVSNLFLSCDSLRTVGTITVSPTATNFGAMYSGCTSLIKPGPMPNLGTGLATATADMYQFFLNCLALRDVPYYDTSKVYLFGPMFSGCIALENVPNLNMNSATNVSQIFNGCSNLRRIPELNWNSITSASNMSSAFTGCVSLAQLEVKNIKFTFTVAGANLSSAALNTLYTNLATVTGQTLTITGNVGAIGDNPTIATAKGWTVTG